MADALMTRCVSKDYYGDGGRYPLSEWTGMVVVSRRGHKAVIRSFP